MSAITIRNLPEATHRALKARAAAHGRSTEAEVRAILNESVAPSDGFGTRISELARKAGGFDIEFSRNPTSSEPIDFR
ncbi:MAG: plasmid stabilization protein [Gordonia sp. (in: high G+C Gram-positive bacteria)]